MSSALDNDSNPRSLGEPVNPLAQDNPVYSDDFDINITRNGAGDIETKWFTDGTDTWTKTYTYVNSALSKISRWVKS